MFFPLKRRLHHRYLRSTAMAALLIGLTLSALQGYRDLYQQDVDFETRIRDMVDATLPAAVQASYSLDPSLAQRVVDGLTARGEIYSARLITDLGDDLAISASRDPHDMDRMEMWLLERMLGKPYVMREPLSGRISERESQPLGYLELHVAPALGGHAYLQRAGWGLVAVLVQTLLLMGWLTGIFLRSTIRPLSHVVSDLQALDRDRAENDATRELRTPEGHEDDEIGYLVYSFNQQLAAAHTQIEKRRQAESRLLHLNEQLEARVSERTQHLNREIAERRTIEAALRHSESRFRDLAEVSSDWFWECNEEGRISSVSERFLVLASLPSSAVIGKTLLDLIRHRRIAMINPSLRNLRVALYGEPNVLSFEISIRRPDDTLVYAQVMGKKIRSKTGLVLGYRGTGHDITRQEEDAEKLRLATAEAEQANAAKSEFLASMSHELRTPMNAILGFAQLLRLQRKQSLSSTQEAYVTHIIEAGDHLLGLINDVLDLARIEAGHLELALTPLDVTALIRECTDMMQPLADHGHLSLSLQGPQQIPPQTQTHIQSQVSSSSMSETGSESPDGISEGTSPRQAIPDDPRGLADQPLIVCADRVRLKQVLINLISNAIKYNVLKGSVIVRYAPDPTGQWVQVDVSDTGIGIPPNHLKRIFDPFHRVAAANQAVEGTGVGLAVTKRLIEAMGGAITVRSTLGRGSTFGFSLPCSATLVPTKTSPPLTQQPSLKDVDDLLFSSPVMVRILYVEDNLANQALMRGVLAAVPGLSLYMAATSHDAHLLLDTVRPQLIFIDLDLPDGDGLSLVHDFKAMPALQKVPMIAVSAHARSQMIIKAKQAGFDDYLCKPFDITTVMRHVVECKKSLMPPGLEFVDFGQGI